MFTDPSEVLARFNEVLVEELRPRMKKGSDVSLNVGDIYYELAPFQSCRYKLGVDSILDYDRMLLRMLAGAGGYLEVESLADRQKIQRQVDLRFPDPAILRDYFTVGVRICSSSLQEAEDTDEEVVSPRSRACPSCAEQLPQEAGVQFCPFCGDDVRRAPCVSCGEELRLNWIFCTACGTEVGLGNGTQVTH
jgi:hypothetical protein